MNTTLKPKRDPEIEVSTLIDGYIVLFNARTNRACTLTPLAALVWEFCDSTNTLDEIVQHLESIPDLPPQPDLKTEVDRLLKDFLDAGLVFTDE